MPYSKRFGRGHGPGIHTFIVDDLEVGERAAIGFDDEAAWGGPKGTITLLILDQTLRSLENEMFPRTETVKTRDGLL